MVRSLESRSPWGLRKAVDRDRKSDDRTRPALARPDRESFRFFQLAEDRPQTLEELIPGAEMSTSRGPVWLSERPLDEFWHPLPGMPEPDPTRIWFDIETRGGRGNPGFLFGAVYHRDGRWWLWQALARTTEEEPALMELVSGFVERHPRLVSYSGTKNDWPFLVSRWSLFGMAPPKHADHLDLFDRAQVLYRGVLPSCRLVTLEHHLCGRWREADLASGYIPIAYQEWLEHRDGRLLAQVLLHNALDVVCLLELEPYLTVEASPLPQKLVAPEST